MGWYTQAEWDNAKDRAKTDSVNPYAVVFSPNSELAKQTIRQAGYIMDRNAGMTMAEANSKWDTNFYVEPPGVIAKVATGVVLGFVTGGPIGAIVGGVGAGVAQKKAVDAAIQASKEETQAVNNSIKLVQSEAARIQAEQQAAAKGLLASTPFGNIDLKNPIVIGGVGLILVLLVILMFTNPNK